MLEAIIGAILGLIAGSVATFKFLMNRVNKEELIEIARKAAEVHEEYEKAKQKESESAEETRDELLVIAEKGARLAETILKAIRNDR